MELDAYDLAEFEVDDYHDIVAKRVPLFESGLNPQGGGDPLFSPANKKRK